MASKISVKITVNVTNGDALNDMRLKKENGEKVKSNTGTYFLCSLKDLEKFAPFFERCENYFFDFNKIREYKILFMEKMFPKRFEYPDNMQMFEEYCNTILNSYSSTISGIHFRNNDTRYFIRFNDNNEPLVKAFRRILYGNVSSIVFEFEDTICYVYPELKYEQVLLFD